MIILGIDPGLETTGYGLIRHIKGRVNLIEAGMIRTPSHLPISERLLKIDRALSEIFEVHQPGVMVLEKLYAHYKHPTTALLMGHARGIACLASGRFGIPVKNLGATKIKKALTGNGHATKQQIQRTVHAVLQLKKLPEPEDVADALAVALSFVYIEAVPLVFRQ